MNYSLSKEEKACAVSNLIYSRPKYSKLLIDRFDSLDLFFSLSHSEIKDLFRGEDFVNRLFDRSYLEWVKNETKWYLKHGVEIIDYFSPNYPSLLRECADPPAVVYFIGKADLTNNQSLSVIGTRVPSAKGEIYATQIIKDISDDLYTPLIVSGLAMGIDISAHRAAIKFNLPTIAILPCGIDQIYPSAHRKEAAQIVKNGGILTEFPRGIKPLKYNFLQRNRIIAGISQGLLVVESRIRGGSMSTVSYALSYGREIFALPGRIDDINSSGSNYLISKSIAQLYLDSSTIPRSLGWSDELSPKIFSSELFSVSDSVKEKILLTLSPKSWLGIDQIIERTKLGYDEVSEALIELELKHEIVKNSLTGDYKRNIKIGKP